MINMLRVSVAAIALFSLSSCCTWFSCGAGKSVSKEVTVVKNVERQVSVGSAKEGLRTETVVDQVASTETVEVKQSCGKCLSTYCPTKGCCGTTSEVVIKRATAQGGTGNPHIGLVPTMKSLVE